MKQKFCQSCGMPLFRPDDYGTRTDGSRNDDYCRYCYEKGVFTRVCTMDEMIVQCLRRANKYDHSECVAPVQLHERLRRSFSRLKRWRRNDGRSLDTKAVELLSRCDRVTLVSVDAAGYPRPAVMVRAMARGYDEVWMVASADSVEVRDFERNFRAGLCFGEGDDSVSLAGEVEVVADDLVRKALWQERFDAIFPGGPADANYLLLRFVGRRARLRIDGECMNKDLR